MDHLHLPSLIPERYREKSEALSSGLRKSPRYANACEGLLDAWASSRIRQLLSARVAFACGRKGLWEALPMKEPWCWAL